MNGLVLIDKPPGRTSHDIVNRWRKLAGTSRAGHLGTLDPMATGLLLIVSGSATRLAPYFQGDEKTYQAEVTFGLESNTFDMEGELTTIDEECSPDPNCLHAALDHFRGKFLQTPPPISAKKINGVPAYKLARKKVKFELKPVEVEVKELELLQFNGNKLQILIRCSAGTYIRSIAHDLGRTLGCGAVLSRLRRVKVNDLSVDDAYDLDELAALAQDGRLAEAIVPTGRMLADVPAEHVSETVEQSIRNGREFRTSPFVITPGAPLVRALSRSGDLIAIGELRVPNVYHPKVVL